MTGEDNVDDIKGHSMRVAGSQHLAALGLALMLIQILARWGGSTIMRYVAEAPLSKLTACYKQLHDEHDLESVKAAAVDSLVGAAATRAASSSATASSSSGVVATTMQMDVLRGLASDTVEELAGEVQLLRQLVADDIERLTTTIHESALIPGTLIAKSANEKVHIVKAGLPAPSRRWRTFCGWRFVSSGFGTLPKHHVARLKCTTCFTRATCQVPQPPVSEEDESRTATSGSCSS